MKLSAHAIVLVSLSALAHASPYGRKVAKRQITGNGCYNYDCTTGTWPVNPSCLTGEYSAVASSMLNPPESVTFDGKAFCSAMLQPWISDISTTSTSAGVLTVTSTAESVIWSYVTHTHHTTTKTSTPSPHGTVPSPPIITATPMPKAAQVQRRDFTVPSYLEAWYFYGRLDQACSCIITSAAPYTQTSSTETDSIYNATVSTSITETYWIVTSVDAYV